MKTIKLDNLISLAKQETAPVVDVADGVLAALSQHAADPYRPYVWISAASAAVAACILIAATVMMQNSSDSVSEMMTYVAWAAQ